MLNIGNRVFNCICFIMCRIGVPKIFLQPRQYYNDDRGDGEDIVGCLVFVVVILLPIILASRCS